MRLGDQPPDQGQNIADAMVQFRYQQFLALMGAGTLLACAFRQPHQDFQSPNMTLLPCRFFGFGRRNKSECYDGDLDHLRQAMPPPWSAAIVADQHNRG